MSFRSTITTIFLALILALPCLIPTHAMAEESATDSTSGDTTSQAASTQATDGSGTALSAATAGADSDGTVSISEDATSALLQNAAFGISSFERQNKGTDKLYQDTYYGYRYPMVAQDAFSVIVAQGYMIVYIPTSAEETLGIDITDPTFQSDFLSTLTSIDEAASNGGPLFSSLDETVYFTDKDTVVVGNYTYRFGVEVEDGYYYATSTLAGSQEGGGGGIYAESGLLTAASDTVVQTKATGAAALGKFFSKLDWSPLWVSLKTTGVAILVIFVLGLLAAWGTVKASDRFKGVFDTIFTIPMVLPPTVCGFLLLLLFGTSTGVGRWFIAHGINIVFTWPAAVIACIVVAFPLMYRTARGAFENLDSSMLDAARTLGWSESKIFMKLMLPLAWPSIAAGTVLAFARAMGEFGATLFFAGNYVGVTQTIPIAIYFDWMAGSTDVAIFWVIVVIVISFMVILVINIYSSHTQRYRRGGIVESGR